MRNALLLTSLLVSQLAFSKQWTTTGNDIQSANSGNVGIGVAPNSSYKLDVNGFMHTRLAFISDAPAAGNANAWFRGAGTVGSPGYKLPSLKELEEYIHRERHLPAIAPATQTEKEGIDIGDNQIKMLAKIEELTLYLVEKDKGVEELKQRLAGLEQAKLLILLCFRVPIVSVII
jgi:hypothetical protein